ncbi:DNA polymerase II large subunit, partial [Candidatus Woesearchaeota archaeon]|nr:DNA polymerase II large subunit [Candidatus Woesearchaeota archaeon]
VNKLVAEILFLGDVLINYGDFANRNHVLAPAGYCPEWWAAEVTHALKTKGLELSAIAAQTNIPLSLLTSWIDTPLSEKPTIQESLALSAAIGVPLHPYYTYHWADLDRAQLATLFEWLPKGTLHYEDAFLHKIVLPLAHPGKRSLEWIGIPHQVVNNEFVVINHPHAAAFAASLGMSAGIQHEALQHALLSHPEDPSLAIIQRLSSVPLRDKSGTYIGSRMGRPEKAKQRKMTGGPHGLFPIGDEGGRLRSFQSALKEGKVTAEFPLAHCPQCKMDTVFQRCEICGTETTRSYYCRPCSKVYPVKECPQHGPLVHAKRQVIDIKRIFNAAMNSIGMTLCPDLIKGVRGTMNENHFAEHPAKTLLRSKYDLYVNKDGTIRYDCSELAFTHFRAREIGTPVEKLLELGYTHDIKGLPLQNVEQILELKPQDVVLPACPVSPEEDEPSDIIMFRTAQYIDDLLTSLYKLPAFYKLKSPADLVGHCIIGLAPHTSAGMLGRIIGFSKTQGFLAHPYYHSACRRDCDGDEIGYLLLMDGFLNFSKDFLPKSRGSTMDAPLVLTSTLTPSEVDDMAFDVDIAWKYPRELYEAALAYTPPSQIKIPQIKHVLNTPQQYEGMGFTHDTADVNAGVLCSAYKTLPSMEDKLKGQMVLAERIRAVDTADVARLVIEKHFIRDLKGNLRKFSMQEFRCVACNEKFRRPPLVGKCTACGGKLLFTITEGSVVKYLGPTISLVEKYHLSPYLKQTIEIVQRRIEGVFGRDKEKQTGLGAWFG